MSKSALYATNTADQTIPVNGVISFGEPIRRFGNNCHISGGNVVLMGCGYYHFNVGISMQGTAAGTAVITLYKDGIPIPGATAEYSTVSGGVYSTDLSCIVRNTRCCDATVTAVITGISVDVTNASATVVKL